MAAPGPRQEFLQDDMYFMSVAFVTAKRSRDPNTQVGACIAKDGNVISVGYNHMPMGDEQHKWTKKTSDHKYLYVCNAVTHAIMNARGADLKGASVYTTLFPHNKCVMNIIVAGITKVFYVDDTHDGKNWCLAAKNMLGKKEIPFKQMEKLTVDISQPENDGSNPYENE